MRGAIDVPGDKSVSHRVALFGLIADGPCRGSGWLESEDTLRSVAAVRTLGAEVELRGGALEVVPPPAPPSGRLDIDCGNSGTTARLLMGLLAGWLPPDAEVTLVGDTSLSSRPMARVVDPLRAMGARLDWRGEEGRLPVTVRGAALRGRSHRLPVPSAQVKSALLLAGLFAAGETEVGGSGGSRDHTELLLRTMGADCQATQDDDTLILRPGARLRAFDVRVPGDPSTAAFFQVAAALVPGSDILIRGQSLNPTRIGALRTMRRAGIATAVERPFGDPAGEIAGDVRVTASQPRPFTITAPEVPALVDEIPVLAVLATRASGESRVTGARELRVKESDRLALMTAGLRALGADVTELDDGMVIRGPADLTGGTSRDPRPLSTDGDHRVAMALAIGALLADGHSELDDDACVAVSFPGFFEALDQLLQRSD